jgi:beta-lactamase regulating signal transducer with metallopeptidase domain
MKAFELLSQPVILRLGWTLVHFVWQATLVAVIVAIALRFIKKQAASLRYATSGLALVSIVVMGIVTLVQVEVSAPMSLATQHGALIEERIEMPVAVAPAPEMPLSSADTQAFWSWPVFKQRCFRRIEAALPFIVVGWILGACGLSLLHLGGWARLYRIRQRLTQPVSLQLQQAGKDIAGRLGVHHAFELFESALVRVPTVIGHIRPVILLPASTLTGLPIDQIEIILAHELAHIKRHDYLINLLQTVVEILGFYHPAIWWLSHTMRLERENCCDDMVVRAFHNPGNYVKTLAHLAEIQCQETQLAVAATGSSLVHRIERLLSADKHEHRKPAWLAPLLSLILIVALAVPTTLTFAARDRRNRPTSDDVTATFNEWINAVVDNDTSTFKIIARKIVLHRGKESNEARIVESLIKHAQALNAYKGLDRLRIASMENKGDHFDILTSPVKDPQGVAGRLAMGINTKVKPFYVSSAGRFITVSGTSYAIPQHILMRIVCLEAPSQFPLIENLPAPSGFISPDALAGFWKAIENHPQVRIISSPQIQQVSGSSAAIEVRGDGHFKTNILATVQNDRTHIVTEYEYDISYRGKHIKSRDKTTLPSDHAFSLKLCTFPKDNRALYMVVQPTALKDPQTETKPRAIPAKKISVSPAVNEAFNEWLGAMKGNDPVALKAIAKKQSRLCEVSETDLIASLKKDAEALKNYTDLEQFTIESYEQSGDRIAVQTPVIKHGDSPEGHYSIDLKGVADPVVTDGILFVTSSGVKYPLHPQTLTRVYQLDSPSELTQIDQFTDSSRMSVISASDFQVLLQEIEEMPKIDIRKMMMLSNSGESGPIETDAMTINLTNTVLSSRRTIDSDLKYEYRGKYKVVTIGYNSILQSGDAIVVGGQSVENGVRRNMIIQSEILNSTSKTSIGRRSQSTEQNTLLSTAYICRVPKEWPLP